ncbi:ElyC/SanA/YdcF family protein [Oceaniradius stylonematis]|uniref:ElyC/SanA/YdcF family protein n=1 Tax=Oceaniradius stylonematis TaxID=2184161 RepID=UPI00273DF986|nr:ElyC/SanA/YdcF family protein [Oceaniradius stylonematis]
MMLGGAGAAVRWFRVLAGLVIANLLVSALLWWLAPAFVAPRWQGVCTPDTAVAVFYGGLDQHTDARVGRASDILRACPDFTAILLGGARQDYSGPEAMRTTLEANGALAGEALVDTASYHTPGNLSALADLVAETDIVRIVLISDALHLLRIETLAAPMASKAGDIELVFAVAWPREDRLAFWWRPNYALFAWIAQLLPAPVFDGLLWRLRH